MSTNEYENGARLTAFKFWRWVLAGSVLVSAAANATHAANSGASGVYLWWALGLGTGLPLALLVMVEGLILAARAGVRGSGVVVANAVTVPLAVIVGTASYLGVLSVVHATGLFPPFAPVSNPLLADSVALGLASVPDLLMIASTVYVMRMNRSTAGTTTTSERESPWARIGQAAIGGVAAKVEHWQATAENPQVVALEEAPQGRLEAVPEAVWNRPEVAPEVIPERLESAPEEPQFIPEVAPEAVPEEPQTRHEAVVQAAPKPPRRRVRADLEPFIEDAERLAEAGLVRGFKVKDYAEVLKALDAGKTPNAIKNSLSVGTSTVNKIAGAAAELDREPLHAVG